MPIRSAQVARAARGVVAEHGDDAAVALPVALEDLDGRRLARAVGAEQAEDLAGRDLEVDARERPRSPRRTCAGRARGSRGRKRPPLHSSSAGVRSSVTLPRAAVIDIGSNTTRLLVAEPDPARPGAVVEVAAHRAFVRLTATERATGIPAEKAQAIARRGGRAGADRARPRRRRPCASSPPPRCATRPAAARSWSTLGEAAGVGVEVLSGEEEARLAFAGATAPIAGERRAYSVVVADVGGGSTELACGAPGGAPSWWASLPVGSGALADAPLHGRPADAPTSSPAPAPTPPRRSPPPGCPGADVAWAVGGSATSLRRLCGATLTADALDAALARVTAARRGADRRRPRPPRRARAPAARGPAAARRGRPRGALRAARRLRRPARGRRSWICWRGVG